MSAIETLRSQIPDSARDIRLNLQTVLQPGSLSAAQRWGVAIASAIAARNSELRDAICADARAEVDEALVDDACAAAALMAMNNVYYRFRHMSGKAIYSELPARLRMNRIASLWEARSTSNFSVSPSVRSMVARCAFVRTKRSLSTAG